MSQFGAFISNFHFSLIKIVLYMGEKTQSNLLHSTSTTQQKNMQALCMYYNATKKFSNIDLLTSQKAKANFAYNH
jgi:hypothetical protein